MGLLGPSKRERQARAKAEESAKREEGLAEGFRTRAAQIRQEETDALYPDPTAVSAVLRGLEANARTAEKNARNLRRR